MLRTASGCVALLLIASVLTAKDATPANLVAGKQVEASAKLQKGDRLVGVWEKKNYVVEIREVKSNGKLRIRWVETGEDTDDVSPTELYYAGDATPTRKSRKSPLPENYQKYDKNNDGQIGMYEWDRSKYAEFRKLDKNHDGFLTPQELTTRTTVLVASSNAKGTSTSSTGAESKDSNAEELPNPGNLLEYQEKVDLSFVFSVTGKTSGGVWGTGPYALDSDLAAAAVHAGMVKDGATGSVKVTILEKADKFSGSAANGVTSVERQEAGPAFTIEAVKKAE